MDGSAIVFNPAGLAMLAKGQTIIGVGATFIAPRGGFTSDSGVRSDLDNKVYPVPSIYITHGITNTIAAGIGLFAPYGLQTDWPATSEARYLGYKSVIRNIYIQPTLAAKLGQYVMVGAGFDLNFAHLELKQREDLSVQSVPGFPSTVTFANLGVPAGTDFADANVSGNATSVGYHAGIIIQPDKRISFGVRFLSRQHVKVKSGTAAFKQLGTGIVLAAGNPFGAPAGTPLDLVLASEFGAGGQLASQDASTAYRLPEQLTLGVAVTPVEHLKLLFDYTNTNWTVFDTLSLHFALLDPVVLPQDDERVHAFRFGGEYQIGGTALRLGYISHGAAEPTATVTPNLPEGRRSEFTAGLGAGLTEQVHLDLAYQYVNQGDRRGRSTLYYATSPVGTPNGLYEFKASLFGATLSFTF
jgi:long-chain fatty acid transport protein